jgi:hypothetical protein
MPRFEPQAGLLQAALLFHLEDQITASLIVRQRFFLMV